MSKVYQLPAIFKRLPNQHSKVVKHLIALREKKLYRSEQQSVLVQGFKTLQEVRDQGMELKSLVVTAKKELSAETELGSPAIGVVRDPLQFPAQHYYAADINLARRILGTASKPGNHDIFAEVTIPQHDLSQVFACDRLLVLDKMNDPGNTGTLIRTAKALGWRSGLVSRNSCDLYNDKVIRASRALSLSWPHAVMDSHTILETLKQHGYTPFVADMVPKSDSVPLWSFEREQQQASAVVPGSGVWFWNRPKKIEETVPKKIALILSSEHHGVDELFSTQLRVSLPMDSAVESLNVANAGSIIMSELNRLMYQTCA